MKPFAGWAGSPGLAFAGSAGSAGPGFTSAGGGAGPRAGSAGQDAPARGVVARGACGPRGLEWFAAHGHRGPWHGHGHWDPSRFFGRFPGGPPHGRGRARRGDVRVAVLALLAEQPMHGYQIMQELESRSEGVWRPSPGSIYPALQLLQDQGLVKAEDVEGRRVFSLTPEGEAAAAESGTETPPWQATEAEDDPRLKLRDAFFRLGAAVRQVGMAGDQDQVAKALEILAEARRRVYALLAEDD
jgi:DNA-binding PadR family transcriptional regulator